MNASSSHDKSTTKEMSRSEALEKVKTTTKEGRIISSSDETKALTNSLNATVRKSSCCQR